MKFIVSLALTVILLPVLNYSQQQPISSLLIYRKYNDTWVLHLKNEFKFNDRLQKNTGYVWENNTWRKASEYTREISLNQDTIQTYNVNWFSDQVKKVQVGKCYNVRNERGEKTDVFFEVLGNKFNSSFFGYIPSIDSFPGCTRIIYPYDLVFKEAEKIRNGAEEVIIKPTYEHCIDNRHILEVFSLSLNSKKELISFESDSTKVLVIYANIDSVNSQPGSCSENIYPNPFSDVLTIDIGDTAIERIDIVNFIGEMIYSAKIIDDQKIQSINLDKAPAGMYIVNLISKTLNAARRL